MKILYFLVVVSAVVCTVWSEAELQDCSKTEDLIECLIPIIALRDDPEFGLILSREDLDRVCPVLNRGMQCIDSYTQRCMTEEERHHHLDRFRIPIEYIEKMCRPGPFQEEFLVHAQCLGQLKDDFEPCIHQFLQKIVGVLAKVIAQDSKPARETSAETDSFLRTICCSLREYMVCAQRIVKEKCGAKTAEFSEDIFNQMSSYFTQDICPHDSDQCPGSSASRNSPLALLLPISLAIISLYTLRPT